MSKRLTLIAVAAILLLGAFVFVMSRLHSPEEVLAPPNPGGEYRQLQQAFEDVVGPGTEYKLQYPDEGEFRSAYVLYDIDGDKENEALVFYTKNRDESNVRVNILDLRDEEWVSVLDESGYGSKIDSVTFADLNADSTAEVILSWSLAGSDASRTLTVHSADLSDAKPAFKNLANMPYKAMQVYDMDNDGQQEILVLWNETTQKVQSNYAALMKMTGKGLHQVGEPAVLDSTASLYDNVYLQEGKTPIAYVDARKDDTTMFTEVLWWDSVNERLRAPFTENATNTNQATLRTPAVPTADIDENGVYEIPVAYGSMSRTSDEEEEPVLLSAWSVTDPAEPGVLRPMAYSLVDTDNRYVLQIDAGQRDSLIAFRNTTTGVITVYDYAGGERGEPLFSLVYSDKGKPKKSDGYTFLALSGERAVYGTLTSAGKASGLTNENIQDSLLFY